MVFRRLEMQSACTCLNSARPSDRRRNKNRRLLRNQRSCRAVSDLKTVFSGEYASFTVPYKHTIEFALLSCRKADFHAGNIVIYMGHNALTVMLAQKSWAEEISTSQKSGSASRNLMILRGDTCPIRMTVMNLAASFVCQHSTETFLHVLRYLL